MALIRILVDGYSLLHSWPELAPRKPRHSMAARDELISVLKRYRDAYGIPITIVFDGAGAPPGVDNPVSSRELEVLFSKNGQTADDIIERVTHRLLEYGDVLVVTNDNAERETVLSSGASTSRCEEFIIQISNTLDEFQEDVARYRKRENQPLNRPQF